MAQITLERARAAKDAALRRFKAVDNVVGIGLTRIAGEYAVKVNLSEPAEDGVDLPSEIGGVPVRFEVTGSIRKR
jgi:hypothetical protein